MLSTDLLVPSIEPLLRIALDHRLATPGERLEPLLGRVRPDVRQSPCALAREPAGIVVVDLTVYADAGQGGFEIRTFLAVSAAAGGATGTVHFCEPIPIFAVSCTIASYALT